MLELIPKLDVGRICNPKHPRLDLNKEHYVCYGIQTVVNNLLIILLYIYFFLLLKTAVFTVNLKTSILCLRGFYRLRVSDIDISVAW